MKTFFRKKCPECGKKSRLGFYQDEVNIYMFCPACQFKVSITKDKDSLRSNMDLLHFRWKKQYRDSCKQFDYSKVPYAKPVEEGTNKKGGINKPPTTPKPKMTPGAQGVRKKM